MAYVLKLLTAIPVYTPLALTMVYHFWQKTVGANDAAADLGEQLKVAWEWMAVLGQVEVYGWKELDVRCCAYPQCRKLAFVDM